MSRTSSSPKTILLAGLAICVIIIAVYLIHPAFVRFLNDKTTDAIMALAPRSMPATDDIVIVDLDEQSLERYGQWPWPRYRLGHLLLKIKNQGAKSIGLNLILSEPDRTSPQNWQATVARELDYQIDVSSVPSELIDHDRYLADILAQGPFVIGYKLLFKDQTASSPDCNLHPLNVVHVSRSNASSSRVTFFDAHGAVCNLPIFADAVTASGFLNATPDEDGLLRRIPLIIEYKEQLFPSFALASLMQSEKVRQVYLRAEKSGFDTLVLNDQQIPVDRKGNMLINFGQGQADVIRISAGDILSDSISSEALNQKIVLICSSAAGWEQTYQTPTRPVVNYGDIQALVLNTMLTGRFVARPQLFLMWETLAGLLIAVLLCIAIATLRLRWSAVVAGAGLLIAWSFAMALFPTTGFLLSPLLPTVLILANYSVLTIFKARSKQWIASKQADDTLVLLKASEGKLDSIIQTIPDIVFRVDPQGEITFISPAISKYADQPGNLIGQPIFELVASEDRDKAQYRLNERRTGERATYGLELKLLLRRQQEGRDEEVGYFSISAEGIYNDDSSGEKRFIGTQGIMRDITAQKTLENRLLQAQKMEVIGNLAAGIAHDLNNILSGLVSYPDLLLLELPPDSPIRDKVSTIQQSGQKAAAIVQDLLTLARRSVKINQVIGINKIVTEYVTSPEYDKLKQDHPQITLDIDLEADLMDIKGSPVHLSKALMNILNNAFEAMPAGGCVRLSTFNTYLDAPRRAYEEIPEGEYVCLSAADEGIGIDAENLQRIFEPFYTKKTMHRSGTGLGMTVIWATVKDHAGYIDVQSKEGEGTRFDLYFPATREVAETEEKRLVLEDYLGTEKILVVDDIPEQLDIAVKMLSKLGYKVSSVPSGEAAVDYMQTNQTDLLVLDMVMPGGMDGLETYKRIIERHPKQKAIIASGYSESARVKALQNMGAGAYLQKPYTLEKIGIAVRRELDRQA